MPLATVTKKMLDHFSILTKTGLVLWSKSFTPGIPAATTGQANNHPVDALIRSAFLEDRLASDRYEKEGYSLQWALANDVELVFVVVYQRILQLTYIPQLLTSVKASFLDMFKPFVVALREATQPGRAMSSTSLLAVRRLKQEFDARLQDWESSFLKLLRGLEREAAQVNRRKGGAVTVTGSEHEAETANGGDGSARDVPDGEDTPKAGQDGKEGVTDEQDIAKNIEALRNRLKKTNLKAGATRRGGKGASAALRDSPASSGADTPGGSNTPGKKTKAPAKEMRKWDGGKLSEKDMAALDFSSTGPSTPAAAGNENGGGSLSGWIDERSLGKKTEGRYEIADVDDNSDEDEENSKSNGVDSATVVPSSGLWSRFAFGGSSDKKASLFSRITGNNPLTEADLAPALAAMQSHLQSKNVAADVAQQLCASVSKSLVGKQVGSFGSIKTEVRNSLEQSITRILTPKTSTDILLEISTKRQASLRSLSLNVQQTRKGAAASDEATNLPDPYSLCFVGVNGVGKSTNLAKVCFWLLQNNLRVLIAACDTFRSGAVEQLRVHVRNLGQLQVDGQRVADGTADGQNKIELYEKGYGKDAAGIAKEALTYARKSGFDVVLIDTAGRMQDNEPLMRALAKLVAVNSPDKILFVGEALVGNEAVDQLTKFDQSLKDFSGVSRPRGLDGMLLTKFDTIDDKVGTSLTATSVTGLPIYFVGVGQTYTDLKQLRVKHIVNALLRD